MVDTDNSPRPVDKSWAANGDLIREVYLPVVVDPVRAGALDLVTQILYWDSQGMACKLQASSEFEGECALIVGFWDRTENTACYLRESVE